MELLPRFFGPPPQSYFLFGPRGTGKSTWVRAQYPDALYLDLLDPETERQLRARPERLAEYVHAVPVGRPVIIDEVQRAPDLLPVVHHLIETRKTQTFILTGSSSRKLKRAGTDLLAGRALSRSFHPFMAGELGPSFDLPRALRLGMLPIVHGAPDPEETLRAYAGLYLREEVQAEGLVRNLGNFSRFLEVMSASHGACLNMNHIAREVAIGHKTVAGYVEILEDLLLGVRLPVFARRARRAVTVHPKFYFFDAGVFRSLRPRGPLDSGADMEGPALEGLVLQHLRAWAAYRNDRDALSFWRTQGGSEIDVVLYGDDSFCGIEVKNTRTVSPLDVKPLRTFRDEYPESTVFLLYRGTRHLLVHDVPCIPCDTFLRALHPGITPADILRQG